MDFAISPSTEYTQSTYAAVLHVLKYADTKPTPYDFAREILTTGLMLPQEAKGAYINGLARLFREEETDPAAWFRFRTKLQTMLLKAQALVQAAEMLLQDWQIEEPAVKQLGLFAQAGSRETVNFSTGDVT
jgi:hypothetical protein